MAAAASDHGDDDEIVFEAPVFLNAAAGDSLVLLQYPLRSVDRGAGRPLNAKWKAANRCLSLELAVPSSADHKDTTGPATTRIDKIDLTSTTVPQRNPLAVGVMTDAGLHLTPVSSVLQMRPDLGHIDRAAAEAAAKDAEANSAKGPGTRVRASTRHRAEAGVSQRRMTLAQLSQVREAEPERPLVVRKGARAAVRAALLAPEAREDEDDESAPVFRATGAKALVDGMAGLAGDEGAGASAPPKPAGRRRGGRAVAVRAAIEEQHARAEAATLELLRRHGNVLAKVPGSSLRRATQEVRVRELLRRAGAVPAARAMDYVVDRVAQETEAEAEARAVTALSAVGRMLRGCWVATSEEKFPLDASVPALGTPQLAARRRALRDMVLAAFDASPVVDRRALCREHGVPERSTREDFEAVAVKRGDAWVWRWEAEGRPAAEVGTDLTLLGPAVRAQSGRDSERWKASREALRHVLKPAAATTGEGFGTDDDVEDGDVPPAGASAPGSPAEPGTATPHEVARGASAAGEAEQKGDESDGEGPGTAAERAAALSAVRAVFEARSTARRGDVKAAALEASGVDLPVEVASWALDRLAQRTGKRGGYYVAKTE